MNLMGLFGHFTVHSWTLTIYGLMIVVLDLFRVRVRRCDRPLNRLGGYIQLCELINEIRPATLITCGSGVFLAFPEGFYGTRYSSKGTSEFIATLVQFR